MATFVYSNDSISRETLRQQIVKSVIDLLFDNNQLSDINQLQRVIDPQTGQLKSGRTTEDTIVIYEQDYQDIKESAFTDFINPILSCHKVEGTGENDDSGTWIEPRYTPFDSSIMIFQAGDTTLDGYGPSILFAYQESNQTNNCTSIEVPVAEAIYTLSQLISP
jgi:hypothetical protein